MHWWHPEQFAKRRAHLEARAKIFAAIRGYFTQEGFVEVDTPALQHTPSPDPHLSAFETDYRTPQGETKKLYLCTSPELTCKKLLVAGMEKIYQLAHVFRNGEDSHRHHPEFTLLEWYRVGADYDALMCDCTALLAAVAAITGRADVLFNAIPCHLDASPVALTVVEAFQRYAGIDLMKTIDDDKNPAPEKLALAAKKIGVRTADDDRWDDIALRIMAERIEPFLGKDAPCFLTDYPLCMAALAKARPDNPRLAMRFELYVCGLELANAFVELTDAAEQRARLMADQVLKQQRYGKALPADEDFLRALDYGMPEAAGIALGVDRLVMLAVGADDIRDVLWAPADVRG